jgi:uncharacterized caspase-like protein
MQFSHDFRRLLRIPFFGFLALILALIGSDRSTTTALAGFSAEVPGKGILYVLSIGVNTYPKVLPGDNYGYSEVKLQFAVADAQAVTLAFSTPAVRRTFKDVQTTTLLDSAATVQGIRGALEHLIAICKPEDVVLFYFAGDGLVVNPSRTVGSSRPAAPEFNFITYDSAGKYEDASSLTNTLVAHELSGLLLSIQAQRQIVILDTCESSTAFDSLHEALSSDSVFTLSKSGRRFALLGTDGTAIESRASGHGLLTSTLLAAMNGDADPTHKGIITEAELEGYMMAHIEDDPTNRHAEQLLSYSDLRGLCLADSRAALSPLDSDCNYAYGYDPDLARAEKTRALNPEEPSAAQQTATRGSDYALILASDRYDHWPSLNNPIYDGQTLQKELIENYGYKQGHVVYRENPTKAEILGALTELKKREFGPDDRLLIYVAGHGHMDDSGEGFLVTKETSLPAEDPYLESALDLSRFRDVVNQLPVPHILVVLDTCYGGSFKERKILPAYTSENLDSAPSLDSLVASKMRSPSRLYIASGGLRQAFDGEPGMHSPFARTFLKTLRQYGGQERLIDMGKLDGAIEGLCPRPYYGTFGVQQEGGDFLFIPKPDAHPVPDHGLDMKVVGPHCS